MNFKDFITEIKKKTDNSKKFEYNDYKILTDNPTTQEWSKFIKELEKDENRELRKNFIKVRDSRNKIILCSIMSLNDVKDYVNKGIFTIEWQGTDPTKKASPKIKTERATLKKDWILKVEDRLKRVEDAVFNTILGNQMIEIQTTEKIYPISNFSDESVSTRMENLKEIMTVLIPFMITNKEKLSAIEILARMNNLEFIEGNLSNTPALARLLIGICESRSEVFNVYKNERNPIETMIEVNDALNLSLLKLYPNKGWLYNIHICGNGESVFTRSLANYVNTQFNKIETGVFSALKDISDDHINPWCVLAICYGAANPEWLFGKDYNKKIEIINKNLLGKKMEIAKSLGGIFYLRSSAPIF